MKITLLSLQVSEEMLVNTDVCSSERERLQNYAQVRIYFEILYNTSCIIIGMLLCSKKESYISD
jgi:hypothetical protein